MEKFEGEDFDSENFDLKDIEFNFDKLKSNGVGWFTRFLLRFFPMAGLGRLARKFGFKSKYMKKANDLFFDVEKIDIVPLHGSGRRGFQIILDRNTALYFYQDGDHFIYDGSEVGKYEKGDVTIFDENPY